MQAQSFCPWYPMAEIDRHAPAEPGVFQVRVKQGLVAYPRGKSAMIHYAYADDVRQAAREWAGRHGDRNDDWLCRHLTGPGPDMAARFEALQARFVQRFGAPPSVPEPR